MNFDNTEVLKKNAEVKEFYFLKQIREVERLLNSLNLKDFWYLKSIQNNTPFLNLLPDDRLQSAGRVILNNLKNLNTRPGIALIVKAIYGEQANVFFEPLGGALNLEITGVPELNKENFILNNGTNLKFKNGDNWALRGYGSVNNFEFDDFITQFLEAGVFLNKVTINEKITATVVVDNGAIIITQNQIITDN